MGQQNDLARNLMRCLSSRSSFFLLCPACDVLFPLQATDEVQVPKPKFPSTLATIVLVFELDDEWREMLEYVRVNNTEPPKTGEGAIAPSYAKMNMQPLVDKLRSADMIVREAIGNEQKYFYCLVSISEKRQKAVADVMGEGALRLRLKKKDDMGNTIKNGGGWTGFKQHLSHLYERSSEGSLFSSSQQQQIMMFMLNDVDERAMGPQLIQKEACELGNTPLEQLIVDDRIVGYYCLHHEKKLSWMERNWMRNYTGKQPIETIREYYGEEIAMQCVFTGYIAKSLWVPATVGILLFFLQVVLMAESFEIDSPFEPLYAIYIAMWTIQLSAGWKSMQLIYELEWGTIDVDVPETDRPEFLQNPRTYKRLNDISKKEEYFPDPLWRGVAVALSLVVFILLIGINVAVVMGLEMCKALMRQQLGEGFWTLIKIVGSMLQAGSIQAFRLGLIPVFDWLTYQENWKLMAEYNTAMTAKRMCFGFFNSYFAIIFVSLLANQIQVFGVDISCPGHKCMGYVEMMIGIIFVQQVVVRFGLKTIKPYYDWKAVEEKERAHEMNELTPDRQQHEKEFNLIEMPTLELEYASKILELGYFALFGASFPLMAFFVLVTTLIEIRGAGNSTAPQQSSPSLLPIFLPSALPSFCPFLSPSPTCPLTPLALSLLSS